VFHRAAQVAALCRVRVFPVACIPHALQAVASPGPARHLMSDVVNKYSMYTSL